ncbi:uncharacterized protein LOC143487813 isoform X2 [Brachyhypopomus gauderio]|uniref:uncharacterized protein LOC143487813 isoform X2 n=1 Tax=Brachyhypopomus gauderio TaxID=698409 RepID=UPI0040419C79
MSMVLVLLTAVAVQGDVSKCGVGHTLRYSAVLGESMLLRLPVTSHTQTVLLRRNGTTVIEGDRRAPQFHGGSGNRIKLFNNGTGRIQRCVRDDAGVYEWKTWDSAGQLSCTVDFILQIQEQVMGARLQVVCQQSGEWRAQCSPPGHSYAWFLNGSVLDQSLAYVGHPGDVIILKNHVSGHLTCFCSTHGGSSWSNATAVLKACTQPLIHHCAGGEGWGPGHGPPHNTVQKDLLCVDIRIFLLAGGATVTVLTLAVAIICLKVAAQKKPQPPELLPIDKVVNTKKKKRRREKKSQEVTYSEVHKMEVKEEQPTGSQTETFLQTFSTNSPN